MLKHDEPDYRRIFLAVLLSAVVLIGWQIKVEWPRRQALAKLTAEQEVKKKTESSKHAETISAVKDPEENSALTREQRISASPRVKVNSDKITGSIALKGARFDDLAFLNYREAPPMDSPKVTLFSPNGDEHGYFAQIGWLASDTSLKVPDQNTIWKADKKQITGDDAVNLTWDNGQNVTFSLAIKLDAHYMFTVTQKVDNKSGHAITLMPYAYLNRTYEIPKHAPFLHEGPLGVVNDSLNEASYQQLKDKGNQVFDEASGWFGITDHYWFSALIPEGNKHKVTFGHYVKNTRDRFQVDYLDDPVTVENGQSHSGNVRLFAGAKELTLLDQYATGKISTGEGKLAQPIPLFDRALDFGSFYFLAKPTCIITDMLFKATNNFGVALLIFIILVKIVMFPLANKSYKSMAQMRALQPEMVKIREKYFDDQLALHRATRELYKREKVNPAAGCLPVIIQLVVFLALFRGLNVTIEMRHAPFLWIQDLSARDPSNLFTLFGMVPWNPPEFLHLGLLPILYCISMVIQTSQQPAPPDPVQAKMIKFMPYFMLLFFDSMAAGFVLYWTFSNTLSIFQQKYITSSYKKKSEAKLKPAATNG